jgi:Protein of unknown function (DUF2752)
MKVVWIPSSHSRPLKALLAAAALCGLGTLALVTPERLPFIWCPFNRLTGHSCLTCGLTRSLRAALLGNLAESIHYHLFGPVLLAGILLACILWLIEASTGKRLYMDRPGGIHRPAMIVLAGLWIGYAALRLAAECIP